MKYILLLSLLIGAAIAPAEEIDAKSPSSSAIQAIYRDGVPHTDKNGQMLTDYDPDRSFFMIGLWGVMEPGSGEHVLDWSDDIRAAGFNTVLPWHDPTYDILAAGQEHDLQVAPMFHPYEQYVLDYADHPNLLGFYFVDEPTRFDGTPDASAVWRDLQDFLSRRDREAPGLKVFVNEAAMLGHKDEAFRKWTTVGDLAMQDNYPIRSAPTPSIASDPNGIPQSVSFAVRAVGEDKPVWFIVQAFGDNEPVEGNHYRYPAEAQLRAMTYAAIIHGATGIVYFAADSHITRSGNNFGISPRMPHDAGGGATATPDYQGKGEMLWYAVARLNQELKLYAPSFLSATIKPDELSYRVETRGGSEHCQAPIRTLLKPDLHGGYYLFVVNTENAPVESIVTFDADLSSVHTQNESNIKMRMVPTDGKETSFVHQFAPFEVNIYHLERDGQPE